LTLLQLLLHSLILGPKLISFPPFIISDYVEFCHFIEDDFQVVCNFMLRISCLGLRRWQRPLRVEFYEFTPFIYLLRILGNGGSQIYFRDWGSVVLLGL